MKFTPEQIKRGTRFQITPTELGQLLFGSVIYALGVNLFVAPAHTYSGGVMGITQLLYTFAQEWNPIVTTIPFISIVYYLLNAPLLVLAYRSLGQNFFVRTLICITTESTFLMLIPSPDHMLVDSTVTSAIIGGLCCGYGAGQIFVSRSSGGGLDVIGMVLTKKYQGFSIGKIAMAVNAIIYLVCGLTQSISVAIYSIIYAAANSMVVDRIHSQNINTEMLLITKKNPEPIIDYITHNLGRSANFWESTSGYTREKSFIIIAVMSKYEVRRFEQFLQHYDPSIFAVKNHGVAIDGNFKKKL